MIGTTLLHYRIVKRIGGGDMGVVYKDEDLELGRPRHEDTGGLHVAVNDSFRVRSFERVSNFGGQREQTFRLDLTATDPASGNS